MKLEYREWLDSVGGDGWVLIRPEPVRYFVWGQEHKYDIYLRFEGDEAWARRVAKHYGIEMPEEKR